jgi:hypothetical protein
MAAEGFPSPLMLPSASVRYVTWMFQEPPLSPSLGSNVMLKPSHAIPTTCDQSQLQASWSHEFAWFNRDMGFSLDHSRCLVTNMNKQCIHVWIWRWDQADHPLGLDWLIVLIMGYGLVYIWDEDTVECPIEWWTPTWIVFMYEIFKHDIMSNILIHHLSVFYNLKIFIFLYCFIFL